MKTKTYALVAVLGLIALAAPSKVHADSIVDVTMSNLTFTGNNACGPSGSALCTQTLNATLQWDNTTNTLEPGSFSFNSSGAIGTSFGPFFLFPLPEGEEVYAMADSEANSGDSLQISIGETSNGLIPGIYTLSTNLSSTPAGSLAAGLSCSINASNQPFFPPNTPCGETDYPRVAGLLTSNGAYASSGVVTVSAVSVAEPSTSALLGAGLFGLIGMVLLRKRLA